MRALAGEVPELGLGELAAELGLRKSTAHRLVKVLEEERFVEKSASGVKYRLGSRLIELGRAAVSRLDLYALAQPHLHELVAATGETAHLAVLRDGEVVSVTNVESRQTVRTPATVGTRSPAHCTSLGKAMLANLPATQIDEFLRQRRLKAYTPKTITLPARFREELGLIKARGYAVDDEEREEGLRCIGAPVRDHAGAVVAAVSIAGPSYRIKAERTKALAVPVLRAAARISAALGFRAR